MMELGQDWISMQKTLFPRKKGKNPESSSHVIAIHEAGKTIRVISDVDDLSTTNGSKISDIEPRVPGHQALCAIEASALDQAIQSSIDEKGVYHQLRALREKLQPTHGEIPADRDNFLIEAIMKGWWGKVLPSHFGIYLQFEGTKNDGSTMPGSLLILFKRGKVDQFDDPDLSSLSHERREDSLEVVKYLREKYSAPIQGLYLNSADWVQWCESEEAPWKSIVQAMRLNRVNLVPLRMSVAALVGARAHLGI